MNSKFIRMIIFNITAILLGLLCSGIMLTMLNINPFSVFIQAITTIFNDKYSMGEVFLKATPLILTALAFSVTYKAGLFNIGAQGQFYTGAIVAISASLFLDKKLPTLILLPIVLLCSMAGGGIIGSIIGILKSKYKANEFLTSMMSTYVILSFMNYLLRTFLKESKGEYPQTDAISRQAWLPQLFPGSRLHLGFILAVITAVLIWFLIFKTALGYRIRAVGYNSTAARMSGINVSGVYIITFCISGALAGMAGFTEVNGVQHMLIQDFNVNVGASGIGIAILSNANPIGIIFASILFGALNVIGNIMGRMPSVNIPSSVIDLMQGFVMLFVIISNFFKTYTDNKIEKNKLRKGVKSI